MSKPHCCVDCGTKTLAEESSYTLIEGGWRLSRRETSEGISVDWRCKKCWRKYKSATGPADGQPESHTRIPTAAIAGAGTKSGRR